MYSYDDTEYNHCHKDNGVAREWDEKIDSTQLDRAAGNAVSIQNSVIEGKRTYLSLLTTATMATSKGLLFVAVVAVF